MACKTGTTKADVDSKANVDEQFMSEDDDIAKCMNQKAKREVKRRSKIKCCKGFKASTQCSLCSRKLCKTNEVVEETEKNISGLKFINKAIVPHSKQGDGASYSGPISEEGLFVINHEDTLSQDSIVQDSSLDWPNEEEMNNFSKDKRRNLEVGLDDYIIKDVMERENHSVNHSPLVSKGEEEEEEEEGQDNPKGMIDDDQIVTIRKDMGLVNHMPNTVDKKKEKEKEVSASSFLNRLKDMENAITPTNRRNGRRRSIYEVLKSKVPDQTDTRCKSGWRSKMSLIVSEPLGSAQLLDGCIDHRNGIIRNEVLEVIEMGKKLGIDFHDEEGLAAEKVRQMEERDWEEFEEGEIQLLSSSMKILSWNIRGLGKDYKRRAVKKIVIEKKADMLFLQETKISAVDSHMKFSLWGDYNGGLVCVPAIGASSGIVAIWNEEFFELNESISGSRWVMLKGRLKNSTSSCIIMNVYAPNDVAGKARLWRDILHIKDSYQSAWIICGDFNAVKSLEERRGGEGTTGIKDFVKFIEESDLLDLPMVGRKFTWASPGGNMSRIDRFFISSIWMEWFRDLTVMGLPKSYSDHNPLLLGIEELNWGPRPFRSLDCWLKHPNLKKVVKEKWAGASVVGRARFKVHRKLQIIKKELVVWNKEKFGLVEKKLEIWKTNSIR